ncbi:MAG: hypothetical protein AB7H77_02480 [Bdellovibrionales bacterium]
MRIMIFKRDVYSSPFCDQASVVNEAPILGEVWLASKDTICLRNTAMLPEGHKLHERTIYDGMGPGGAGYISPAVAMMATDVTFLAGVCRQQGKPSVSPSVSPAP